MVHLLVLGWFIFSAPALPASADAAAAPSVAPTLSYKDAYCASIENELKLRGIPVKFRFASKLFQREIDRKLVSDREKYDEKPFVWFCVQSPEEFTVVLYNESRRIRTIHASSEGIDTGDGRIWDAKFLKESAAFDLASEFQDVMWPYYEIALLFFPISDNRPEFTCGTLLRIKELVPLKKDRPEQDEEGAVAFRAQVRRKTPPRFPLPYEEMALDALHGDRMIRQRIWYGPGSEVKMEYDRPIQLGGTAWVSAHIRALHFLDSHQYGEDEILVDPDLPDPPQEGTPSASNIPVKTRVTFRPEESRVESLLYDLSTNPFAMGELLAIGLAACALCLAILLYLVRKVAARLRMGRKSPDVLDPKDLNGADR